MFTYRLTAAAALCGLLAIAVAGELATPVSAAPPVRSAIVPDVPANKDWDVDEASATFTGGGNGATTIQLVLDKAAVSGRTVSVQSDGDHITLSDATSADVRVVLAVDRKSGTPGSNDGVTSTLQLVAGDHPTIAFDDHDSVRETGHWRRIAHDPGRTFTLSMVNATFAIVRFPPAGPAVTAAPVEVVPPPRPVVDLPLGPRVKPAKLQVAVRNFADSVARPCTACGGTGKITRQVQVGSRQQGIFSVPITQNQTLLCDVCHGTGLVASRPAAILQRTADLIRCVIDLDLSDPDAQDAMKATYEAVTNNAVGNRQCWDVLTRDARSTLSLAHPRLGTALITEVMVDEAATDPLGRRTFHAHLPGTTNEFLIENPPSADNVAQGPVLMGGLITRVLPADDLGNPPTAVVRGAFLISPDIDRRWTWWVSHDLWPGHR